MLMSEHSTYTIEEVAQLLRVSKLTVYDLIKKEELVAYRVGRQMRVDEKELERYKIKNATSDLFGDNEASTEDPETLANHKQVVISGQDVVLDMLSKYIEKHTNFTPLRSYHGSLNSLISMYQGDGDVVSV